MLKAVSVTQANALLDASYQLYRHVESSETIVRTVGYALPAALHEHVLTMAPMTSFVSPPAQWQTPRNRTDGAAAAPVKPVSDEPATTLSGRDRIESITSPRRRFCAGCTTRPPIHPLRRTGMCSGLWDIYGIIRARWTWWRLCANTAPTRRARPSPSCQSTVGVRFGQPPHRGEHRHPVH